MKYIFAYRKITGNERKIEENSFNYFFLNRNLLFFFLLVCVYMCLSAIRVFKSGKHPRIPDPRNRTKIPSFFYLFNKFWIIEERKLLPVCHEMLSFPLCISWN